MSIIEETDPAVLEAQRRAFRLPEESVTPREFHPNSVRAVENPQFAYIMSTAMAVGVTDLRSVVKRLRNALNAVDGMAGPSCTDPAVKAKVEAWSAELKDSVNLDKIETIIKAMEAEATVLARSLRKKAD